MEFLRRVLTKNYKQTDKKQDTNVPHNWQKNEAGGIYIARWGARSLGRISPASGGRKEIPLGGTRGMKKKRQTNPDPGRVPQRCGKGAETCYGKEGAGGRKDKPIKNQEINRSTAQHKTVKSI